MTDINELNDKQLKKIKMKDITDPILVKKLEHINILLKNFNKWMKNEIAITDTELKRLGIKK